MRDEYNFKKSKQNPYAKKFDDIVESSWVNSFAKLIKKFKSSKSYWSINYFLILFMVREAGALAYSAILTDYVQKKLEGTTYSWLWSTIEFIFGFGGNWFLLCFVSIIFLLLWFAKVSEGENNTISLKENFLSLLLSFSIMGMSIYMIRSNSNNHNETHKQQEITNDKLDNITALIKLKLGDKTLFLEKYFGKDYSVILKHPQTYHNFTTLLKKTNKTADELLKEREELLKKIESQSFSPKLQNQITKAFKELRYEDARELLDAFLEANADKEKEIIKAHYIKALTYMEQIRYHEAKDEFEKIPFGIKNPNILSDYANIYNILGKYNKAIELYEKVLKITFSSMIDYQPNILNLYNNIGIALYRKGEYDKSLKYYEKSLKIRLLSLRKNHPDIALDYMNICLVLHKKGKSKNAQEYSKKAQNIIFNIIPEEINTSLYNKLWNYTFISGKVIIFLARKQQYQETFPKIFLNGQWNKKQDMIIDYENNISLKYRRAKHNMPFKCSIEEIKRGLINDDLDEKNLYTVSAYKITASGCYRLGMYDKALKYYEKALKIEVSILGENHPNIATIYESIGSIWDSKGKYDKALKYYEKSLKIRFSILGKNHLDTAISYHYIGSTCYRKGEYKKAIKYYKKTLKILNNIFPNGHPNIGITMKCLKSTQESLKNNKK